MARVKTESILSELERRDNARTSLARYANYVLGVTPALHHELICQSIDELLNDDYDELIILAPPGSAKSTYTSIALPPYFLGRWPNNHILATSYATELAEKWGRRARNILDSQIHQILFPDSLLSKDNQAAGRWSTTANGEFYAAGVGSGILGFRADLALIDDPISGFEQAQSLTQLQKIHGWYETDFVTRLKPKGKTILICQRLARNDLAGYLIDRNLENPTKRQRILKLPMEAREDDPLHRNPGDRLWPDWFTPEMVEDAKRDDFKWRTLYQQEPPSDSGEWVSKDEIQIVDIAPAELKYYQLTDLALSVNSGDYSVHLIVGVDPNQDWFIVDAYRQRSAIDKTVQAQFAQIQTYHPGECLIDDDNASKVYMQYLARMSRESGIPVNWKPMPLRGQDKETRAAPTRGWFKRRKVYMVRADWNRWLVTELLIFPNAIGEGVDDGVDALSLLGRRLSQLAAPALVVAPPPPKTLQTVTLNDLWEDKERRTHFGRRI